MKKYEEVIKNLNDVEEIRINQVEFNKYILNEIEFLKEKLLENINIVGVYVDKLKSIDERLNRLENR